MPYFALTLRDGLITGRHESAKPITQATFEKTKFAGDEVMQAPGGFKAEDEAIEKVRGDIRAYLKAAILDNKAYLNIAAPTASERNAQVTKLTRQMIRAERLLVNDMSAQE